MFAVRLDGCHIELDNGDIITVNVNDVRINSLRQLI